MISRENKSEKLHGPSKLSWKFREGNLFHRFFCELISKIKGQLFIFGRGEVERCKMQIKRVLRIQFWPVLQTKFFRLPTNSSIDPEAIHIWLTHHSKALIFYFDDIRKKWISDFENFIGNRQAKFYEFKLRVCVITF